MVVVGCCGCCGCIGRCLGIFLRCRCGIAVVSLLCFVFYVTEVARLKAHFGRILISHM